LRRLDEEKKAALRATNYFSSETADLLHQKIKEVLDLAEKEQVLQSSPHRPEGHQPQPWLKQADDAMKVAGVVDKVERIHLLRLYNLMPYRKN
jgi:hypothetical protein